VTDSSQLAGGVAMSLELLRRTATIAEYPERDTAFHQAIASATHNALLIEIAGIIGRARERTNWGELTLHEGMVLPLLVSHL
jgi:DNA-binding FadR family transcriptional regulator